MVGGVYAVVHLLFQLCGSAGHLFYFPQTQRGIRLRRNSTWSHRLCFYVGLCLRCAARWIYRGSGASQGLDSGRLFVLEQHHCAERLVWQALAVRHRSRAGGFGRNILFPSVHVVAQRLSWPSDTIEGAFPASVGSVSRHDRRQLARGMVCGEAWMANRGLLLRRGGGTGRAGAVSVFARTAPRECGSRIGWARGSLANGSKFASFLDIRTFAEFAAGADGEYMGVASHCLRQSHSRDADVGFSRCKFCRDNFSDLDPDFSGGKVRF